MIKMVNSMAKENAIAVTFVQVANASHRAHSLASWGSAFWANLSQDKVASAQKKASVVSWVVPEESIENMGIEASRVTSDKRSK